MKSYLLFDSGCSTCSKIAKEIEHESEGRLVTHTLNDPEMQELINSVKPDWQWEPTLLEVGAEGIRAFTGLALRKRLLTKLGLRRAWHIAQMASQLMTSSGVLNAERRSFLQQGSAILFALAL